MLGVRGLGLGAALTFGAVLWWATRGTESAAEGFARLRESPASHADASRTNTWSAAAVRDDPAAPFPDEATAEPLQFEESQLVSDLGFEDYVDGKYRFLMESVSRSSRGAEALRAALMERERMVVAINTAKQGNDETAKARLPEQLEQLAEADWRITRLLPAADLAAFAALKDSHIEQFQLEDYAQGISNVAPLRDADRRAILYSKLAARAHFREVLDHSGLMRGDLSGAQREAVLHQVSRALRESRDSFLQEARQHLGDEQYRLLANYEHGEYAAELEKLRQIGSGS